MASKVTNSARRYAVLAAALLASPAAFGPGWLLGEMQQQGDSAPTAADGLLFQVTLELAAVDIRITLQYGDAVEKERAANAAAAATHVSSLTSAWAGSIITIPCYLGLHARGTL